MKNYKGNIGLLDKNRFKKLITQRLLYLKNLSLREALRQEESLISSEFICGKHKNYSRDNPVCLKISLGRK